MQKELEVTQKLEKLAPSNMQTMADSSISYDHVSRELLTLKRFKEAMPVLIRVLEIREMLIEHDPDSRRLHAQMHRPIARLGRVYNELNQPKDAVDAYERGLRVLNAYKERTGDRSLDRDIGLLEKSLKETRVKIKAGG